MGTLTDVAIKAALAAKREKMDKLRDGEGLFLAIQPSGTAAWRWDYAFGGTRKTVGLGPYPELSLKAARLEVGKLQVLLAQGVDPAVRRREERLAVAQRVEAKEAEARARKEARRLEIAAAKAAGENTVRKLAEAVHKVRAKKFRSEKHAAEWLRQLEHYLPSKVYDAPIHKVVDRELADVLTELHQRVPETASRILQRLRLVWGYARLRGLVNGNPLGDIRDEIKGQVDRPKVEHHAAPPYTEAKAIMDKLAATRGVAARALRFAVYTWARSIEVRQLVWRELDLAAGVWVVPGSKYKTGDDHLVPLSREAVALLQEIKGDRVVRPDALVFPPPRAKDASLSDNALSKVLRDMGLAGKATAHGFARSTSRTWGSECTRFREAALEACLGHQEEDRVKAAYDRAQFNAERRAILQAWADYLAGREHATVYDAPAPVLKLVAAAA